MMAFGVKTVVVEHVAALTPSDVNRNEMVTGVPSPPTVGANSVRPARGPEGTLIGMLVTPRTAPLGVNAASVPED